MSDKTKTDAIEKADADRELRQRIMKKVSTIKFTKVDIRHIVGSSYRVNVWARVPDGKTMFEEQRIVES